MLAIAVIFILTAIMVYYYVFSQGLFSTIIMAALSVVSAITALNYYEPLAVLLTDLGMASMGPQAISLLGLFTLTLLGLRELSDRFIGGNIKYPQLVDRVGSFFFGTIAALVIGGMISLGVQHLPIGQTILQFDRCSDLSDAEKDSHWWPRSDEFVMGLLSRSSKYCFKGLNNFEQVHPDSFLRELYFNRIVPKDFDGMRHEAAKDAIRVEEVRVVEGQLTDRQLNNKIEKKDNEIFLAIRVVIHPGTGEKGERGAADDDGIIRYAPAHIRLVGYNPNNRNAPGFSRYPLGFMESTTSNFVDIAKLDDGKFTAQPHRDENVVLLFKWPGSNADKATLEKSLRENPPLFLEFKYSARGDMPGIHAIIEGEKIPPKDAPKTKEKK